MGQVYGSRSSTISSLRTVVDNIVTIAPPRAGWHLDTYDTLWDGSKRDEIDLHSDIVTGQQRLNRRSRSNLREQQVYTI